MQSFIWQDFRPFPHTSGWNFRHIELCISVISHIQRNPPLTFLTVQGGKLTNKVENIYNSLSWWLTAWTIGHPQLELYRSLSSSHPQTVFKTSEAFLENSSIAIVPDQKKTTVKFAFYLFIYIMLHEYVICLIRATKYISFIWWKVCFVKAIKKLIFDQLSRHNI